MLGLTAISEREDEIKDFLSNKHRLLPDQRYKMMFDIFDVSESRPDHNMYMNSAKWKIIEHDIIYKSLELSPSLEIEKIEKEIEKYVVHHNTKDFPNIYDDCLGKEHIDTDRRLKERSLQVLIRKDHKIDHDTYIEFDYANQFKKLEENKEPVNQIALTHTRSLCNTLVSKLKEKIGKKGRSYWSMFIEVTLGYSGNSSEFTAGLNEYAKKNKEEPSSEFMKNIEKRKNEEPFSKFTETLTLKQLQMAAAILQYIFEKSIHKIKFDSDLRSVMRVIKPEHIKPYLEKMESTQNETTNPCSKNKETKKGEKEMPEEPEKVKKRRVYRKKRESKPKDTSHLEDRISKSLIQPYGLISILMCDSSSENVVEDQFLMLGFDNENQGEQYMLVSMSSGRAVSLLYKTINHLCESIYGPNYLNTVGVVYPYLMAETYDENDTIIDALEIVNARELEIRKAISGSTVIQKNGNCYEFTDQNNRTKRITGITQKTKGKDGGRNLIHMTNKFSPLNDDPEKHQKIFSMKIFSEEDLFKICKILELTKLRLKETYSTKNEFYRYNVRPYDVFKNPNTRRFKEFLIEKEIEIEAEESKQSAEQETEEQTQTITEPEQITQPEIKTEGQKINEQTTVVKAQDSKMLEELEILLLVRKLKNNKEELSLATKVTDLIRNGTMDEEEGVKIIRKDILSD